MRIGFIGSGKMAEALIKAILSRGIASSKQIISSDRSDERLGYIEKETKIAITRNNSKVVESSDIIFIAVKPADIKSAIASFSATKADPLFVSIAAGIKLKSLENMLKGKRIIRVMPNAPCLAGEMAAAFSLGDKAGKDDEDSLRKILEAAGIAFKLEEKDIDIVTALSGSGPAFFTYFIKAMVEEAVKQGLEEKIAFKLACQTAIGTGKMLLEKDLDPDGLINMISSPNGTTVAGREVLEKSDAYEIIKKTVRAAYVRSREIGEQNGS